MSREMEEMPAGEKSARSCRHSSPPANPAFRGILKSPSLRWSSVHCFRIFGGHKPFEGLETCRSFFQGDD